MPRMFGSASAAGWSTTAGGVGIAGAGVVDSGVGSVVVSGVGSDVDSGAGSDVACGVGSDVDSGAGTGAAAISPTVSERPATTVADFRDRLFHTRVLLTGRPYSALQVFDRAAAWENDCSRKLAG